MHAQQVDKTRPYLGENGWNYPSDIEQIRQREYPALGATTYLDHAGTTLYPKSMIEDYTADLTSNLFGNPHSATSTSQLSTKRIDNVRLQVLQFFQADPSEFDIVFVANATAAIKLVADAFRDHESGFRYGYHSDSHTSLVGVRELAAAESFCFSDDTAVNNWISDLNRIQCPHSRPMLFAYPGQSNMTGRKLPYEWCSRIRRVSLVTNCQIYSLFDAAALASTSPLNLSNPNTAPDFVALSFYKIFGFPDLGGLIVRKASSDVLRRRKYFGGGTVDMVSPCIDEVWHKKKQNLHAALEDGTLQFHNIIALEHALQAHKTIYGSMRNIQKHTTSLRTQLYERMAKLRHGNGKIVCQVYGSNASDVSTYGPVVSFNLLDSTGKYVNNAEVERLGIVKNIQFRTGGLCNPGGIARHLNLGTDEMKTNYAAGHRCGGSGIYLSGKPSGAIRVSLGAMSSETDIDTFIKFIEEFYVCTASETKKDGPIPNSKRSAFFIESMSVFPIKSCAAFWIPTNIDWEVSANGLAWDREWCLVHQGTKVALSQKQYPGMALIQPRIDLQHRMMVISHSTGSITKQISIPLDKLPSAVESLYGCSGFKVGDSMVCGENVPVYLYTSKDINNFFSEAVGVPCALARYPDIATCSRLTKLRQPKAKARNAFNGSASSPVIRFSNESPILLVSRSSVNRLNYQIQQRHSDNQVVLPESFRANIVVSEQKLVLGTEAAYAEDNWQQLSSGAGGAAHFKVLGPCQRCQMVCVDQNSAKRRQEPFSTLAKTRKWGGGVWFGIHICLKEDDRGQRKVLRVGDPVNPS